MLSFVRLHYHYWHGGTWVPVLSFFVTTEATHKRIQRVVDKRISQIER